MNPSQISKWRREVLPRLEALQVRARQIQQVMEKDGIKRLEDKKEFEAAWEKIKELFPDDLHAERVGDLGRHMHFAYQHDFYDIEHFDIPAVIGSVQRYGRSGEAFITEELDRLDLNSSVSELIHPQIRDVCVSLIDDHHYREAARKAVELVMDEARRLSGASEDGDALIRRVIGTTVGQLAFSNCKTDNEKNVTKGLKQVAQGLYKGVRNPCSHHWDGFSYIDVLQVMSTCSLLLTRIQLVSNEDED